MSGDAFIHWMNYYVVVVVRLHTVLPFQTREEGKALLRQILQLRNQNESPSADLPTNAPFLFPQSVSASNTPTRRVSPLNLSSVTP